MSGFWLHIPDEWEGNPPPPRVGMVYFFGTGHSAHAGAAIDLAYLSDKLQMSSDAVLLAANWLETAGLWQRFDAEFRYVTGCVTDDDGVTVP